MGVKLMHHPLNPECATSDSMMSLDATSSASTDDACLADSVPATQMISFIEGDELYAAMVNDIRSAVKWVRLETYIYAGDEVGRLIADAMKERAQAGCRVRLRIDSLGSFDTVNAAFIRELEEAGVEVEWCRRWQWRKPFDLHRRNHRKMLIVDKRCFYLGGFNFHRECSRSSFGDLRWRDTHVRVEGQLVNHAIIAFDEYDRPRRKRRRWRDLRTADGYLIPSLGFTRRFLLHRLYRFAFHKATQRLWITTPYFVPPASLQRALIRAAKRGVDVRILVPRRIDIFIVQWASRAVYARLLAGGVRIFEYLPRMLHAKCAVIDDGWATVGTANLDYRSLFINDELVLVITQKSVCDEIAQHFLEDLQCAEEITGPKWAKRRGTAFLAEMLGWWTRRWL